MRSSERVLILGLGNPVLRDDGVGLVAARRVKELVKDAANLREECVSSIDLLPVLSGYRRVVVVDGYLSSQDPPGTRIQAIPEDLPPGFCYRSLHMLSFREMMDLGERLGYTMPSIRIHGLCVEDPWTFGDTFTPAIEMAWQEWAGEIARSEFGHPCREAPNLISS